MRDSLKNTKTTSWTKQLERFFQGEMSEIEHTNFVQLLYRNPHLWAQYLDMLENAEDNDLPLLEPSDSSVEWIERMTQAKKTDKSANKTKQSTVNSEQ